MDPSPAVKAGHKSREQRLETSIVPLLTGSCRCRRLNVRAFVPECISGGATMKPSDLVVVSTFPSTADARIAKGILDGVGIESMIRSDNAGGMYPAIGGADLLVRAEDVKKATEALQRRHSPR